MHKHLLGDLYAWAGKIRNYTTGRGAAPFARPEYIESYFATVHRKLVEENFLIGTDKEKFSQRSAFYASEVNAIHPFIHGNGRVTRLFLKDLAAQAGYTLSIEALEANKGAWYEAMKQAFNTAADTTLLQAQILSALNSRTIQSAGVARAKAFETLTETAATKHFPELKAVYASLRTMHEKGRESGLLTDLNVRQVTDSLKAKIIESLNAGLLPKQAEQQRSLPEGQIKKDEGPER